MVRARRFRDLGSRVENRPGRRTVRADGQDVFVHYSEIDGYGFRSLEENQHVEFEVTPRPEGAAGRPCPRRLRQGRPSLISDNR